MPDLDGFTVCRRLKQNVATRAIPIILITALDSVDDLVRGLDAGADEFLAKPVARLELQARVRTMLRIKAQVDELAQALALRQRLADLTAHELRTPLTAVLLQLELLRRRGELAPEQAERVALALAEAQSMSAHLDDMLMLVRLEGGRHNMQSRPVELGGIVRRLASRAADLAKVRGMAVEVLCDEPVPNVEGDPLLLARLVENLAGAALKIAPAGSYTMLRVTAAAGAATTEATEIHIAAIVGAAGETEVRPGLADWVEGQPPDRVGALRVVEWEMVFCRRVAEVHHGRLAALHCGDRVALVAVLPAIGKSAP
jgi:signal transduction histidine kinase